MFSDVLRCFWRSQDALKMCSDDHKCWTLDFLQIFSRCSLDVLWMFSGFFQDVLKGLESVVGLGGLIPKPLVVWRSFQIEVRTLIIQRNSMILWYPMIQREFQLELWTRKLLKSLYNTTLCDYLLQLMISAWMKVLALLLFSSFSTKSTWIKHFILNVLVFLFSDIFVFYGHWNFEF